jgi:hypothetical protein
MMGSGGQFQLGKGEVNEFPRQRPIGVVSDEK